MGHGCQIQTAAGWFFRDITPPSYPQKKGTCRRITTCYLDRYMYDYIIHILYIHNIYIYIYIIYIHTHRHCTCVSSRIHILMSNQVQTKTEKNRERTFFLRFFEKNTQSEAIPVCSEMSYGYPYSVKKRAPREFVAYIMKYSKMTNDIFCHI